MKEPISVDEARTALHVHEALRELVRAVVREELKHGVGRQHAIDNMPPRTWLYATEAAAEARIRPWAITQAIRRGELHAVRIPETRGVRIERTELERWIKAFGITQQASEEEAAV